MRTYDVTAPVQGLGVTERDGLFVGLGNISKITPATQTLIGYQNEILSKYQSGKLTAEEAGPEFRKAHWGVMMNGMDDQAGYLNLAPFVKDVTPSGEMVFEGNTDLEAIESLGELYAIAQEYNESADPTARAFAQKVMQPALQGLQGLGSMDSDSINAIVGSLGDAAEQAGLGRGKFKRFLKKAGRGIFLRFNPLTITARNSFLVLVRVNLFKIAEKLRLGLLTREEATALSLDYDKLDGARKGTQKALNIFYKLGGKKKNLIKAIVKGSRKKKFYRPLLNRKVNGVGQLWYSGSSAYASGLRSDNGLKGLGELQYYGRDIYNSGLRSDNGLTALDEAVSELMDTGALGVLNELIYSNSNPQNPHPWIGEIENAYIGALGVAPLAPVIAAATSVMVPIMKIVKVISKVAGPAVKAAIKIRAAVKKRQEKVRTQQEEARQRQEQEPQQQQQGLGKFSLKNLFKGNPAKRQARIDRRAAQGGSKAGKFLRSLVPGLPMSKKTAAAMQKMQQTAPQTPLITDGGIPTAGRQAAQFLMANNPYTGTPGGDAGTRAAELAAYNTPPPPAQTSSSKPLKTALIVGGVVIVVGLSAYLIFKPKKSTTR